MAALILATLVAGCGGTSHKTTAAVTTTSVLVAQLQAEFNADNAPFADAIKANEGFPAIEQSAGDSGRLLQDDTWPAGTTPDVTQLEHVYAALEADGSDFDAVTAGLSQWHTAYNRAATNLGLPTLT